MTAAATKGVAAAVSTPAIARAEPDGSRLLQAHGDEGADAEEPCDIATGEGARAVPRRGRLSMLRRRTGCGHCGSPSGCRA